MVTEIRGMGMEVCTTLGMLSPEQARQLKEAGLTGIYLLFRLGSVITYSIPLFSIQPQFGYIPGILPKGVFRLHLSFDIRNT